MFKDSKARFEKGKIFPFIPTGEYYFDKGIKAYDRFDINKAKKYLKRALELEPNEPMIACQLAIVYTEAGEYEESNELLLTILNDLDPEMTECHYFLANNFAHLGFFPDAMKHASLYLESDQEGEFALDAEELIDFLGEDEDFERLAEQDEIITRIEEARLMLETGDFNQAVKLLEKAVDDYPEFWPAHNNLALAYFYEGETGKAAGILEKVLENNPGNLHALCNLAVFLFYEDELEQLEELLTALEKVKPMLFEHRYKLGATFALTGRYEQAYHWLRQIYKYGYGNDAGYYYWLAKSSYFMGNEKLADIAWKELAKINPEQGSIEPWKVKEQPDPRYGEDDLTIMKMLRSHRLEERLYAIFLIAISDHKRDLITHSSFKQLEEFSFPEKMYLAFILETGKKEKIDPEGYVKRSHEIASLLYSKYKEEGLKTRGLVCAWFAIFIKGIKAGDTFMNVAANAAAVEYVWLKQRNNKKSQKQIAEEYDISSSTLSKYIRIIETYEE